MSLDSLHFKWGKLQFSVGHMLFLWYYRILAGSLYQQILEFPLLILTTTHFALILSYAKLWT